MKDDLVNHGCPHDLCFCLQKAMPGREDQAHDTTPHYLHAKLHHHPASVDMANPPAELCPLKLWCSYDDREGDWHSLKASLDRSCFLLLLELLRLPRLRQILLWLLAALCWAKVIRDARISERILLAKGLSRVNLLTVFTPDFHVKGLAG